MVESNFKNDWKEALSLEFEKPYYKELAEFLIQEYNSRQIFPPKEDIFNAFNYTSLKEVRVLIIGQDPYHDLNQAHGLAFSVGINEKIPPSLRNIFKELKDDLGYTIPNHGYLKKWADQGVMLLNTVLTVRAHEANSHKDRGWENLTDAVIMEINKQNRPMVIILWGKPAQSKSSMLNNPCHLILKAPHPSPLSAYRGFFGSKPFSQCNEFLSAHGLEPIHWELPSL
jgi:uracil-DNA glycosylase